MARRRRPQSYARRAPKREAYDYVLIVCEGAKTEKQYFDRLIEVHKLSIANVHVTPANGSDPLTVARFAEELHKKNAYDRVYCVFDRDGHQTWGAALELLAAYPGVMFAAKSWPCFEIWLLLHFDYTSAPFEKSGKDSSCDKVGKALRRKMPQYEKGHATIYDELSDRVNTAITHALRLTKENARTKSTNPSTNLHELVEYLQGLKTET